MFRKLFYTIWKFLPGGLSYNSYVDMLDEELQILRAQLCFLKDQYDSLTKLLDVAVTREERETCLEGIQVVGAKILQMKSRIAALEDRLGGDPLRP